MITVSIVIYKTVEYELKAILDSLSLCKEINTIYLIDNSPTERVEPLPTAMSNIEYIWGHGNVGYGAAHNIALKKSLQVGVDYHLVVNPDIQFGRGVIEALVRYMNGCPDVGLILPKVVSPEGEEQYLRRLLPTPFDLIGRRFIPIKSIVDRSNARYEMYECSLDRSIEAPFLSGCFMFMRVEALQRVGLFSDLFWMYCEDIDLSRRINEYYKTVYYPSVSVVHAHHKESYVNKKLMKEHIKSALRYFNKWGWLFDKKRVEINRETLKQVKKGAKSHPKGL